MARLLIRIAATAAFVLLPSSASAEEAPSEASESPPIQWTWTAGFDFSRGDYGLPEKTNLYYIPLGVTADYRRFRANLVIPVLASDGPTRFIEGSAVGDPRVDSDLEAGLGQIQASVSYLFDPLIEHTPFIELVAKITAPTETSDGLGTGDWAGGIQIDLFQIWGHATPFASAGRRFFEGSALRDRFYTSVGASLAVHAQVSIGLSYDWLESTTREAEDAHEIVPFLTLRLDERWSMGPYAVIGLSDGSPDYGVGLSISLRP
jgi:hypothetical protein